MFLAGCRVKGRDGGPCHNIDRQKDLHKKTLYKLLSRICQAATAPFFAAKKIATTDTRRSHN
jgi:hypothetical protein